MSGHKPWWQIKHKAPDTERARLLAAGGLNEPELAAALMHTYGITNDHAAEIAAAHNGRLPADVQKIPLELPDPNTVWAAARR